MGRTRVFFPSQSGGSSLLHNSVGWWWWWVELHGLPGTILSSSSCCRLISMCMQLCWHRRLIQNPRQIPPRWWMASSINPQQVVSTSPPLGVSQCARFYWFIFILLHYQILKTHKPKRKKERKKTYSPPRFRIFCFTSHRKDQTDSIFRPPSSQQFQNF